MSYKLLVILLVSWAIAMEAEAKRMLQPADVDVYYLVSTEPDSLSMAQEMAFVHKNIFPDFRFCAPHYHQYTFDQIINQPEQMDSISRAVGREVCGLFDAYMAHGNHGRPFILAGFSQGGDMVVQLLQHLSPRQQKRMVCAYVIGFHVSAEDTLQYPAIRPARGERDWGVTVVYNSVLDTTAIWPFVAGQNALCINPINWRTDATPAQFLFDGREHQVQVDTTKHVLVVRTDPSPYQQWMLSTPPYSTSGVSASCLHHWDILFYNQQLRENAIRRLGGR